MKIASFNINNINRRLTNLLDWLSRSRARHRVSSGTQSHEHRIPGGGNPAGGISCRLPRRELRERRGHSSAMDSGGHSYGLAGRRRRPCRYLEAAINGALVASIYAPIGNPQPGSKFDYKFAWLKHRTPTRLNCTRVQRRSCWREITTLCRQTSTFTKRSPGIMTPFCSPRAARRINAFSRKAGSIPFARSIQRADVHLTST